MPRVKLSEYRSKVLLGNAFNNKYTGISVNLQKPIEPQLKKLSLRSTYVVKVDQAVKKRNKLGLVFLNRTKALVIKDLQYIKKKGYVWGLVEPFVTHERDDERYVALQRTPDGVLLSYSEKGGVDIEENKDSVLECMLDHFDSTAKPNTTSLSNEVLQKLYELFQDAHMTYLEINPAIMNNKTFTPLDAAVEVDSSAAFFISGSWTSEDMRVASRLSVEERAVEELASKSPASFNLKLLNKDGAVFLLLSGGGASIVVADEFAAHGLYSVIANYGEYSGGPNAEETYTYTQQVLALLIASKSKRKVLFIGGGTANFTDVAKTFKGVLQAMEEVKDVLKQQKISVFVRRGGPNQKKGLTMMELFLKNAGLVHEVCGPEVPIARLVKRAAKELK